MKQNLLFFVSLLISITSFAYDIEQDGVYYNFIDDKYEVSVSGSSKSETIIPNRIFYDGKEYVVTAISKGAFYNRKDLLHVEIGDSLRQILDDAFNECVSLSYLRFGKKVNTIGARAFSSCKELDSICIPDSVTTIGIQAFKDCAQLKYVEMGKSVNYIDNYAFGNCYKLEHLVFKKPIKPFQSNASIYFSTSAFSNCTAMKRVDIDDLKTWCNTSANGWPASPLTYGPDLYLNNELIKNLVIPDDAEYIGRYAFSHCPSIISVELPEKIYINSSAFDNSSIQKLTIKGGESTYLNGSSFSNCRSLLKIIEENETPAEIIHESAFDSDTYYKGILYVPIGVKSTYKSDEKWSKFLNIKEGIPSSDVETYVLTIYAGYGGTVSYDTHNINDSKESIHIDEGTIVKIAMLPYSGYVIDRVLFNNEDVTDKLVDNKYTIEGMYSDASLDVSFRQSPLYLTICQTNSAIVKQKVEIGERYEYVINPSDGWKITNVMFNGSDVTSQIQSNSTYTTPKITEDSKLEIIQEKLNCMLTCTIGDGGIIYINDTPIYPGCTETSLSNGLSVSIRFEPTEGYYLKNLYIDGYDVARYMDSNTFNYGLISKDFSIQAIFEKNDIVEYNLEIQDADYGLSSLRIPNGQKVQYFIRNIEGWNLNAITFNGIDVTSDVVDDVYVTPEINGNSLLTVSFEKQDNNNYVSQSHLSDIKIYGLNGNIIVNNANVGDVINIYKESGILVLSEMANQSYVKIPMNGNGIYIVKIANKIVKIIL
jgi:hypothetical protein